MEQGERLPEQPARLRLFALVALTVLGSWAVFAAAWGAFAEG